MDAMKSLYVAALIGLGLGLGACDRQSRSDEAARRAGREAYRASQDVKKGAKEAARDLRSAGKEFREGWSEAERQEAARRPRHEEPKRRDEH